MNKNRLEAFSDGVIAVIITILVLELKAPEGTTWVALRPLLPHFLSYVLSFVYVGIFWNNHHHLLHATKRVSGGILWANLHLLFWISLIPLTTTWMGENHLDSLPVAVYGTVLFLAATAYFLLTKILISHHGRDSTLALAIGKDGKALVSALIYAAAISLAFVFPIVSILCYVGVAVIWLVPDRRIERKLTSEQPES